MIRRLRTALTLTARALSKVKHLGPSPLDPLRRGLPVLLHLPAHVALTRLLSDRRLAPLVEQRGRLLYKYIWPYLLKRLARAGRLDALMTHYRFVAERAPALLARLLDGPHALWEHERDGTMFAITFGAARMPDAEGELELTFRADGTSLFHISFALVKGAMANLDAPHVLLVGSVQGAPRELALIRRATRACGDVALAKLLVDAAVTVAAELGLRHVVGVSDAEHVSRRLDPHSEFSFDYDALWKSMHAIRRDALHVLDVQRPLDESPHLDRAHRRRARQRHRQRRVLRGEVGRRFRELLVTRDVKPPLPAPGRDR